MVADGKPRPELATSWEAKNGATEWIFNLRKGVKFSDGQDFNADDAIYSLNLHRGDTKSGGAGSMKPVTDIKKLDKYQIQISLDAADADLPYVLTDYHVLMVPDGFKDWSKPVGTGAFSLDKFDPGVRISVKKTRDYWKEGRGHLDAVEITVIDDGSARLNALVSGQIDIINRVDHKAVALLSKIAQDRDRARARRLACGDGDAMRQAALRQSRHSPGAEIRHRPRADPQGPVQRLRHARQRSPDPAHRSLFQQGTAAAQTRSREGRLPSSRRRASPIRRSCCRPRTRPSPAPSTRARCFRPARPKPGIKVDLKKEPADGFWDNVWLKGAFVSKLLGRPRRGDADAVGRLRRPARPGTKRIGTTTSSRSCSPTPAARPTRPSASPTSGKCRRCCTSDGGAIIPVFRDWLDAHNDKVGGHTPHGGFDMDNGYILEKAWIKA